MKYDIFKAPELDWLKANSVNGTPEGIDSVDKEYKRTWCSIELFDDVLEGDYNAFSACQPEKSRITVESFNEIRKYVKSVLKTDDDENAMRAFLVINDLGKVGDFVKKIADNLGFESVDHDKILYEGLKAHPEFSPTFSSLEKKYQQIILTGLCTAFNMGQYVQCECLPANLEPLIGIDSESLNYYMIHVLFDIAGATGHVNSNGSLICNELYWKKFSFALKTIIHMVQCHECGGNSKLEFEVFQKNGNNEIIELEMHECYGPTEAYEEYLERTRLMFELNDGYIIAKLCNLIRVSNSKEAREVSLAWSNLEDWVKSILCKELQATGIDTDSGILLYYAPATFQNALNYYKKKNPDTAIAKTVEVVAPLIAQIYARVREAWNGEHGYVVAFISDIAKSAMNPDSLKNLTFSLERVGDDFKVCVE